MNHDQTYYIRARHRSLNGKVSAWSTPNQFQTEPGPPTHVSTSPASAVTGDNFGTEVACNHDRTRIVVGAPSHDTPASNGGKVYFYEKNGSAWDLKSELTASDVATNFQLGFRVTMSSDGEVAAAYAVNGTNITNGIGRVYIFQRNGDGTWTERAILTSPDPAAGQRYGFAISLNSDGTVLAVGALKDDHTSTDVGSVTVYTRSGFTWTERHHLFNVSLGTTAEMGTGVHLSNDGRLLAATTGAIPLSVQFYSFSADFLTSTQEETFTFTTGSNHFQFGQSIDLSENIDVMVVSARGSSDPGFSQAGAVAIARKVNGTWTEETRFYSPNAETGGSFGYRVCLSRDGNRLVVTAPAEDNTQGNIYRYQYVNGTWQLSGGIFQPADLINGARFGNGMDIDDTGRYVAVGAMGQNTGTLYFLDYSS